MQAVQPGYCCSGMSSTPDHPLKRSLSTKSDDASSTSRKRSYLADEDGGGKVRAGRSHNSRWQPAEESSVAAAEIPAKRSMKEMAALVEQKNKEYVWTAFWL